MNYYHTPFSHGGWQFAFFFLPRPRHLHCHLRRPSLREASVHSSLPGSSSSILPIKTLTLLSQTHPHTGTDPSSSSFLVKASPLMAPPAHHHHFLASSIASLCLFHLFLIQPNPSLASRPVPAVEDKAAASNASIEFIRTSCSSTTYPDLCFSTLRSYAGRIKGSPMLLAHTALSISIASARTASSAMKLTRTMSPREEGAMSDCMENVADSISRLKGSLAAMGNLRGKDVSFQINSIQTWVSAALTDDNSCMDGFAGKEMEGSRVKTAVGVRLAGVTHLTSNALSLINAFASTTQSAAPAATPSLV